MLLNIRIISSVFLSKYLGTVVRLWFQHTATDFASTLSHQQESGQTTSSATTKCRMVGNVTVITTVEVILPKNETEALGSNIWNINSKQADKIKARFQLYLVWEVQTKCPLSSLIQSCVSADQSQWPCGLRRGSVASHLVELQVFVPQGAWVSVASFVCCQRSLWWADYSSRGVLLYVMCSTECGCKALIIRSPWPARGCCAVEKNVSAVVNSFFECKIKLMDFMKICVWHRNRYLAWVHYLVKCFLTSWICNKRQEEYIFKTYGPKYGSYASVFN